MSVKRTATRFKTASKPASTPTPKEPVKPKEKQ